MNINNSLVVSNTNDILQAISEQAHKLQTVAIVYENSTDGLVWRETEPYEIKKEIKLGKQVAKYYGYDVEKADHIRCFNVEYILGACPLPNNFVPRWEIKL